MDSTNSSEIAKLIEIAKTPYKPHDSVRSVALDRLIEYAQTKFKKTERYFTSTLIIKPCGAFKEHPSFYAIMTRKKVDQNEYYALDVRVDGILNDSYQYTDLNVFHTTSSYNEDDLDVVIRDFVEILDDLKFDKFIGRMIRNTNNRIHTMSYQEILSDLWVMNNDLDCCVCNERTNTQTICGHRLCILCWASNNNAFYKENDDEDDHPKCPMCRQEVTFKNKGRFDDEHE